MPVPASSILPTLADFKARASVVSSANDDELQDLLDAAVEIVEQRVGLLDAVTVTETHYDVSGKNPIVLRRTPALEVTALTNVNGSTWATSDVTLTDSGLLRLAYNGGYASWSGDVTVTYTAGRDSLPRPIFEAILIVAGRLLETQRGNQPSARRPEPDELGFDPNGLPLLPPRALELLQPYLLGPTIG